MNNKNQKELNKNLRLLVKSSFVLLIGLFLSKLLSYFYRIIIARTFGPEIYGYYVIAIMIFIWFTMIFSFGFYEGLLRYLPWYIGKKQDNKLKYLFRITNIIVTISGIIATIILFLTSDYIAINIFHSPNLSIYLKVFSFLIPLFLLNNIFLSTLLVYEKVNWYSFILNILQNVIKVVSLIFLIFIGLKTNAIIISYSLGIIVMLIFSYFACKYFTPKVFGKNNLEKKDKKGVLNEFFSYSWPLLFSLGIAEIFYWADTFLIGYFKSSSEVGFYNAAIPIALLMMIVPELFLKLLLPLISKDFSKGNIEVVKQTSQQVGKWIFILNLPIFIIMYFFPGVIINILFGSEYLVAYKSLKILVFGSFIYSLVWIHISLLAMAGKSRLILVNLVLASILNIILNILLIPSYGINGAALATTISRIILSALLFIEVYYYLKIIPLRRSIIKVTLLTIIPTVILFYLRNIISINIISLILLGIFFFLSYILIIIASKSLDENDLMIIKSIKDKILKKK